METTSKIYVAGHRGMVGSAIVRELHRQGYTNLVTRTHKELDLTRQEAVEAFFAAEKPEYVFLAAAKVGGIVANQSALADFMYENMILEMNVIHSAWKNGCKKLEFLGSSCIYPRMAPQPMPESCLLTGALEKTNEAYALAKISGLKYCEYLNKQYETDYISVMPTNLYGPNDNYHPEHSHVLPALIRRFHEAKVAGLPSVTCWGDGSPLREFLYVDDLANLCVFLMNNYSGDETVNAGTGKEISIADLTRLVACVVGYEGEILWDTSRPNGTPRKLLDVSKASALGWTYKTELEDGIRLAYQDYLNNPMRAEIMAKKVFVSGCYDLLHSGHVEFFRQAAQFGDLYVGIGSDATVLHYKNHKTLYPEQERLFMVKSIRYVKDAFINAGDGVMDFIPTVEALKPDVFVVNADGSTPAKEQFCRERGIEYVVLQRTPAEGLKARSSTDLKAETCRIPTRLDLAGTWIDQPYVSYLAPGWAITISLEPTFKVRDRCGLSTSTRKMIQKIWPIKLPDMEPEMLAKLVFCFENDPERSDGIISGAQDSIGICVPGLCRHYYNNRFWPEKIETCADPVVLDWLESHLVMVPLEPRKPGCNVVAGKDITEDKVNDLADAAEDCWKAILAMDLSRFAAAYRASFAAQVAMFPAMVNPVVNGESEPRPENSVQPAIDFWSAVPGVLAWKMPGAGGGGYLALVVEDASAFASAHPEAIQLHIRRK